MNYELIINSTTNNIQLSKCSPHPILLAPASTAVAVMTRSAQRPARGPAKRPAKRPKTRPAKSPVKRPVKSPAKRPAKSPAKSPSKLTALPDDDDQSRRATKGSDSDETVDTCPVQSACYCPFCEESWWTDTPDVYCHRDGQGPLCKTCRHQCRRTGELLCPDCAKLVCKNRDCRYMQCQRIVRRSGGALDALLDHADTPAVAGAGSSSSNATPTQVD